MDLQPLRDELDVLLIEMYIPEHRRKDLLWLGRHIDTIRETHPKLQQARKLILQLLREEALGT